MIPSNQTPSQLIKASAGTGKTHRLSLRILRLLALGAEPHEIVALTFTRTAAAEFVRRAIKLIKEAAEDPKKHLEICAAERGADLDPSTYTQGFFKELLVKTLLQYDQMLLGTLDSYFARLVNNFPLEVGLEPGKASTVPEHEEDEHRLQVIAQIMAEAESDPELNKRLLASIQEYRDDEVSSSPLAIFDKVVKTYLRFYTLCPDATRWGEPSAIWGDNIPAWMNEAYCDQHLAAAWSPVEDWAKKTFSKQPAGLRDLGVALSQKPKPDYEAGLRALYDFFEGYLTTGEKSIKFGRETHDLSEVAEHVTTLHKCLGGQHILAKMRSTKGLFNLLEIYRHRYDAIAIRTGRLTFSDYVNLLQTNFMPGERKEEVDAWIDQIHFRLDCQIQHWMLDEFQDTSTTQYAVLSRNILEILGQKFSGRSVFVVGDLKQSLYEWREGNRRLLTQVEDSFKTQNAAEPGTALTDELTKTWRCAPAVLAMVNAELGGLTSAHVGETFPAEALSDWSEVFKTQEAMDTKKKGEALWVKITTGEQSSSKDVGIKAQAKWIAHHLRSTPGLLHEGKLNLGLSCAILVSKNEDARLFAEELRNLGIRATDEAKSLVSQDNPVTLALIAVLQRTIHPDNQKAKTLAEMCPPVRTALESFGDSRDLKSAWKMACAHVATTFAAKGARAVMDDLIQRTKLDEAHLSGNNGEAFVAQRLGQLRQMASDFDKLGQRDLAGFEAFASKATRRDAPSPDSVQAITIHKSKGLEYDAVYIPLLEESNTMGEIKHDAIVYAPLGRNATSLADRFNPAWMLKNVHKSVNTLAPAITAGVENMRAEAAYGSLCRLYVGMTRAKHRLVLMHEVEQRLTKATKMKPAEVAPNPRDEKSGNFDFLDLTTRKLIGKSSLGTRVDEDVGIKDEVSAHCLWKASGSSADWVEDRLKDELSKAAIVDDAQVSTRDFSEQAVRRQIRIKPSKGKQKTHKASRSGQQAGKAFGTLVHGLFEGLKWDVDDFLRQTRQALPKDDATLAKAFARVENCLSSPDIKGLLVRNQGGELWTEKHAVLQDKPSEYVSAVFDRVQVFPGKSAVIVDYKTNACTRAELVEMYQEQMDLYRKSVASMCSLPESSVETWLIHVRLDGSEAIKVAPKP
jgi:ATP-dependent exoDNAse (exonuclease V) beta subunit